MQLHAGDGIKLKNGRVVCLIKGNIKNLNLRGEACCFKLYLNFLGEFRPAPVRHGNLNLVLMTYDQALQVEWLFADLKLVIALVGAPDKG